MARIRIAKATSGAAFVNKKKATEARLAAVESGLETDDGPEDIFELQHHHLLRCLEKTTVSDHISYDSDEIEGKICSISSKISTKIFIENRC